MVIRNCGIDAIPENYRIPESLHIISSPITSLAPSIKIGKNLAIRKCPNFANFGKRQKYAGNVYIEDCLALEKLPEKMVIGGVFRLEKCPNLSTLPNTLTAYPGPTNFWGTRVSMLNCPKINALPEFSKVDGQIDIGGTSIETANPAQYQGNEFSWRGFAIEGTALFNPESLDPKTIMRERNAEIRRLLVERYGIEKLLKDLNHKILDQDTDPGGPRRLIRFQRASQRGEDICFLDCSCPSTARRYLLEVPPRIRKCHAAAAWLAGFDNPADYQPVMET